MVAIPEQIHCHFLMALSESLLIIAPGPGRRIHTEAGRYDAPDMSGFLFPPSDRLVP
jgi:hypothetical protein